MSDVGDLAQNRKHKTHTWGEGEGGQGGCKRALSASGLLETRKKASWRTAFAASPRRTNTNTAVSNRRQGDSDKKQRAPAGAGGALRHITCSPGCWAEHSGGQVGHEGGRGRSTRAALGLKVRSTLCWEGGGCDLLWLGRAGTWDWPGGLHLISYQVGRRPGGPAARRYSQGPCRFIPMRPHAPHAPHAAPCGPMRPHAPPG
jgi:hypothetical protein